MKNTIRQKMLQKRDTLPEEDISEKSRQIEEKILSSTIFQKAEKVFVYIHCRSEVRTRPLIEKILAAGKETAVPITHFESGSMYFSRLLEKDLAHMKPVRFGLTEPQRKDPVEPDRKTLFLIPGAAYDLHGNRIGYGAGYYDRYLEKREYMHLAGICYDFQLIDKITPGKKDIPMDFVITENRRIKKAEKNKQPESDI